eukprot:14691798-Ditylum_brightwellii.AAC.1
MMDQKCAALSNPEEQPPRKYSYTIRDYFIPKHKRRRSKKNGMGGASALASRASEASSISSVSKGNFVTEKTLRVTKSKSRKLHEIMVWTTVPIKSERERMLALCAMIDIHEHNPAFPAGDGNSTPPPPQCF